MVIMLVAEADHTSMYNRIFSDEEKMKRILSDTRFQTYYLFLVSVILFFGSMFAYKTIWLMSFIQILSSFTGIAACICIIIRKELWTGRKYIKGIMAIILSVINLPLFIMLLIIALRIPLK